MKQKNFLGFLSLSLWKSPSWIIFILLIGFMVRFLWWAYAKPIPVSDFAQYLRLAEEFLKLGHIGIPNPSALQLPGYPIFLAIILLISDSIAWLSFVNVILSTIIIFLVYKIAINLTTNHPLSLIAALICALNPTFVYFSPVLASEHLYAILFLLAFLVLFDNSDSLLTRGIKKPFLIGILFGTAILTRGEGLFYIPILLIMTYFLGKINTYRYLVALILGLVITIAPWYIRNYYLVGPGSGLSTSSGINFYYAHNNDHYGWYSLDGTILEGKNELHLQKLGYQLGINYLTSATPLRLINDIKLGTKNLFLSSGVYSISWSIRLPRLEPGTPYPTKQLNGIYWFKLSTQSYFPLLAAAILSCLFLFRYSLRTWIFLYGIVITNWIGYTWIFWGKARYRYISEVIFCILGALFLFESVKWFSSHKPNLQYGRKQ